MDRYTYMYYIYTYMYYIYIYTYDIYIYILYIPCIVKKKKYIYIYI